MPIRSVLAANHGKCLEHAAERRAEAAAPKAPRAPRKAPAKSKRRK